MDLLFIDAVKDVDLLIATACIEATIPFRRADPEGRRPPELLAERIRTTNEAFGLGLSPQAIRDAVISAVCLSNRDVDNFAEDDPGRFLDNTWKLLPESNPALRFRGLYTINNYALALMKMEGFLQNLTPESVFHRYDGYPEEERYNLLITRSALNLTTARQYLGIKMISSGILKGLAELTGGDAPVAFFMGDIQPKDEMSTLASHLPDRPTGVRVDETDDMYRLLKHGRASSSRFDLKTSPLSLFVHSSLDDETQNSCIDAVRKYIKGEITVTDYFSAVPGDLVSAIAKATAKLAFTRQTQLLDIAAAYAQ